MQGFVVLDEFFSVTGPFNTTCRRSGIQSDKLFCIRSTEFTAGIIRANFQLAHVNGSRCMVGVCNELFKSTTEMDPALETIQLANCTLVRCPDDEKEVNVEMDVAMRVAVFWWKGKAVVRHNIDRLSGQRFAFIVGLQHETSSVTMQWSLVYPELNLRRGDINWTSLLQLNRQQIKESEPINILLLGPHKAGKSAFINHVTTALQPMLRDRIQTPVELDEGKEKAEEVKSSTASTTSSKLRTGTRQMHKYRIRGTNIYFWDIWGWTAEGRKEPWPHGAKRSEAILSETDANLAFMESEAKEAEEAAKENAARLERTKAVIAETEANLDRMRTETEEAESRRHKRGLQDFRPFSFVSTSFLLSLVAGKYKAGATVECESGVNFKHEKPIPLQQIPLAEQVHSIVFVVPRKEAMERVAQINAICTIFKNSGYDRFVFALNKMEECGPKPIIETTEQYYLTEELDMFVGSFADMLQRPVRHVMPLSCYQLHRQRDIVMDVLVLDVVVEAINQGANFRHKRQVSSASRSVGALTTPLLPTAPQPVAAPATPVLQEGQVTLLVRFLEPLGFSPRVIKDALMTTNGDAKAACAMLVKTDHYETKQKSIEVFVESAPEEQVDV